MSHIVSTAFSYFPSEVRGGALTTSYKPLTLHAVRASVRILGVGIQVKLHLESINETTANQKVIMVYPVPLGWKLQHCVVQYDGQEQFTAMTQSSVFLTSANASGKGTEWASSGNGKACRVASQYIPWEMMVGTSIYAVATYHVPMVATPRCDVIDFSLPVELFPFMERPHQTVLYYNMLFQLKAPRALKSGLTIEVEQATLFQPLSGPVKLLLQGNAAGPETELTEDLTVEYRGDSSFSLHYFTSQLNALIRSQPFVIRCPVTPTMEPLRLFAEVALPEERGREGNHPFLRSLQELPNLPGSVFPSSVPLRCPPFPSVLEGAGKYAVCLGFAPLRDRQYADEINAELIFVLDAHSIESAKAMADGLRHVLPGLPRTVYVNFIFPRDDGNDYALYMDGSERLKKVNIRQVVAYVEELTPQRPYTGTSRLSVVTEALLQEKGGKGSGKIPNGHCRNIIILSDEGENKASPHESEMIIRSAVQCTHKVRISSVGLTFSGHAAVPFLHLLARETYGVFEKAATPADLLGALVTVVSAAAVPTLTQIQIQFPGEGEKAAPSTLFSTCPSGLSTGNTKIDPSQSTVPRCCFTTSCIPVIPLCHQRYFYVLLSSSFSSPYLHVIVTGVVGTMKAEFNAECALGSSVAFTHPPSAALSPSHGDETGGNTQHSGSSDENASPSIGLLHLTAAAARIAYLVDPDTSYGTSLTKDSVEEVKALSFSCSLPSPFTSLVVQPTPTSQVVPGQNQAVVVASSYVSTPATYALIMDDHQRLLHAYDNPKKPLRHSDPPIAACLPVPHQYTNEFVRRLILEIISDIVDKEPSVVRLLPFQRPDGSFPLNAVFANCLKLKESVMQDTVPSNCEKEEAWATAIALAAARAKGSPETTLMERQASRYLKAASLECEVLDFSKWVTEAGALLERMEGKTG